MVWYVEGRLGLSIASGPRLRWWKYVTKDTGAWHGPLQETREPVMTFALWLATPKTVLDVNDAFPAKFSGDASWLFYRGLLWRAG